MSRGGGRWPPVGGVQCSVFGGKGERQRDERLRDEETKKKEDRPRIRRMNGEDFIFRRVTSAENHGSGERGGERGRRLET